MDSTQKNGRAKIAYFTINDPLDKRSWSGATYYMGQALQRNLGDVDFLGPVKIPWLLDKTLRGMQKFTRTIFGTEYIPKYSHLKNIYASLHLKKKMKGKKYDFVMAPAAASELAYLKTNLPVIYYADATYKVYSEEYKKEFKNLNAFSKWEGDRLEKKALHNSSVAIFSSGWAAESAMKDYKVAKDKIEVIQMGANIDTVPSRESIFDKEKNETLTLLFLSVDWDRKGGPIAFDALKHLHASGVQARLIICGCIPPPEFAHPFMEVIPFLNKNKKEDFERFVAIISNAHFLLLPTRADCTPLVNCEANAYGVPVVTTDVGGVSEAVKNGVNGYCLPFDADGAAYANLIVQLFADKEKYHALIQSSRDRYDEVLNWDKFADNLRVVLKQHAILS